MQNVLAKSSHDFFFFFWWWDGGGPFVSPDLSPKKGQRGARGRLDWHLPWRRGRGERGWGGFGLRFLSTGPGSTRAPEVGRGLGRPCPRDRGDPSRSLRHRVLPVGGARTLCLSRRGSCGVGSPAQDREGRLAGSLKLAKPASAQTPAAGASVQLQPRDLAASLAPRALRGSHARPTGRRGSWLCAPSCT